MSKLTIVVATVLFITNFWTITQRDTTDEYENLIYNTISKSLTYQLDKDARKYQARNTKPKDFGSFDFIVIGGGAAGAVIASRLSEMKEWKVLLLEAGKFANNVTDMPAMDQCAMLSDYNWGFYSVPQKYGCLGMEEKRCLYPRGRGVGGSSLINAIMNVRGNSIDYDKWDEMGNSGWSYKDLLPYFKRIENFRKNYKDAPVDWDYHGTKGKCGVGYSVINNTRNRAFHKAFKELGSPYLDYNGVHQLGSSPTQFFIKNGRRQDTGTAYIKPILTRKNLVVSTESYVTKINIDDITKTAKGVYFSKRNVLYYAEATKEVILSAGAFQSPQLLMLSGVGPEEHLKQHDIDVVKNLSVGNNLKDHISIFLSYTDNFLDQNRPTLRKEIQDYINGTGLLTAARKISSLAFMKTKYMKSRPDVELILAALKWDTILDVGTLVFKYTFGTLFGLSSSVIIKQSFIMAYIYLHPKSVGTVRLKSKDPYDYPLIDPNIFSDREDLERMYTGLQEIFKVTDTKAFKEINAQLAPINFWYSCGPFNPKSKTFWQCYIKQSVFPFYHPTSTCSMGPNPRDGAVVDNELKVYGVKHLRVADASVIPLTISGHTYAISIVIGEKAADFIKEKYKTV